MHRWLVILVLFPFIISGCRSVNESNELRGSLGSRGSESTIQMTTKPPQEEVAPIQQNIAEQPMQQMPQQPQPSSDHPTRTPDVPKPIVDTTSSSKTKELTTWGELAKAYGGHYALRGQTASRRVALSFDDAPDVRYTERILSILKENQVKATFFIVGVSAEQYPTVVKKIQREGHVIGNHTARHKYLPKMTVSDFEADVEANEKRLEALIGYKPKLFRPPYGEISEPQLQWAAQHNYMVVNWDVDTNDWSGVDEQAIIKNVLQHVRPGSIVLQHAGIGPKGRLEGTVNALPGIIRQLKAKGYEFVTIPDLLQIPIYR